MDPSLAAPCDHRKRYLRSGLEAARLRLALGSLLHPRVALHAAIGQEQAPDLVDLLFSIAQQPQLQYSPVSLKITSRYVEWNIRGIYYTSEKC